MHLSRLTLPLLAAALAGCATAPRPEIGPPAAERVPTGAALNEALAAARLRFNTAARVRDVAGMAAMFESDAIVITPTRDTVRGRDAIAERIAELAPPGGAVAQLLPRRVEECADGAIEFGGDWVLRPLDAAARELARGHYAVRWSFDPAAGMRVRTLVLHGPSPIESARARREVRCVAPHVRVFAGRRWELSLSPPHAGVSRPRAGESIGSGMSAQGFRTRSLRTPDGSSIQPGLDTEESQSTAALAVRWWVRPPFVLELFAPFAPEEAVVRAYDEGVSADVVILHSARTLGALASYEWRRLRVGAGPVVVRSSWREREERLVTVRNAEGVFGGFESQGFTDDETYTTTTVALLAEAGYTYPVGRRVFADVRVHLRSLASGTTHGTTSLGPIEVDLGGFSAALGFGYAF